MSKKLSNKKPVMEDDVAELALRFNLDQEDGIAQLVPQCMYCQSVCNEAGEWVKQEAVALASGQVFSHGTCPDCEPKLYAQLGVDVSDK